ncbi:hypothetical protein [Halocatena salina]|uniref:Uncharacterized protein n=1 Tax=Halocatena salina TaxID=2934340 RepID=A0A8U0A8T7_9EURY|nr:hypothetical protein [Halocatena salina]UPM45269.1 hypothetical protein MW046_19170 [Halocatena salina]
MSDVVSAALELEGQRQRWTFIDWGDERSQRVGEFLETERVVETICKDRERRSCPRANQSSDRDSSDCEAGWMVLYEHTTHGCLRCSIDEWVSRTSSSWFSSSIVPCGRFVYVSLLFPYGQSQGVLRMGP